MISVADAIPDQESTKRRNATRGRRSIRVIDEAPMDLDELPLYFAGLDVESLAGGWVGCIVSAFDRGSKVRLGDVARVLVCVAERLHGVKFEKPPEGVWPEGIQLNTREPMPNHEPSPARPIALGDHALRGGATGKPENRGWKVVTDRAHVPPPTRGHMKVDPLLDQLIALKPGQYVVIEKDLMSKAVLSNKLGIARRSGADESITRYTAADGRHVVYVPEPDKS